MRAAGLAFQAVDVLQRDVRDLVRQGRRGLEIVKQSPGYDLDLLCRAGCVAKARDDFRTGIRAAWR